MVRRMAKRRKRSKENKADPGEVAYARTEGKK